ncbi:hypothetical protein OIU76_002478 [Salix suchowensis]|nr:hypothetical protein OIU76_002478 [Salix suchowensis]
MASIPHFYSDYPFSSDEFSEFSSVMAQDHRYARTGSFSSTIVSNGAISGSSGGAMLGDHQDHNFPTFYDHKHGYALNLCEGESEIMSPSPGMNSLPDQRFGIADMVVPTLMDYKMGSNCGIAKFQNFGGGFQLSDVCEYGEDCFGILPKFTPVMCTAAEENWRLEYNPITAKRKHQHGQGWSTIKYACRKTLADRRVRVRGRFARNNETFEEETEVKKNDDNIPHRHHEKDTYCTSDAVQIKNDEEDEEQWLQEALASLMYVPPPYIAG